MSIRTYFENIADAIKDKNPNVTNVTPEEMPNAIRTIPSGSSSASGVTYDNTTSGLSATNVQDAIDEVVGDVTTINSDLSEFVNIDTRNEVTIGRIENDVIYRRTYALSNITLYNSSSTIIDASLTSSIVKNIIKAYGPINFSSTKKTTITNGRNFCVEIIGDKGLTMSLNYQSTLQYTFADGILILEYTKN